MSEVLLPERQERGRCREGGRLKTCTESSYFLQMALTTANQELLAIFRRGAFKNKSAPGLAHWAARSRSGLLICRAELACHCQVHRKFHYKYFVKLLSYLPRNVRKAQTTVTKIHGTVPLVHFIGNSHRATVSCLASKFGLFFFLTAVILI